jgi:hypothetical protein
MKTSRKPRTTKTRTKSKGVSLSKSIREAARFSKVVGSHIRQHAAYLAASPEEIDRRSREYDEARDRAALVWKGIGEQAREMNFAAARAATIAKARKPRTTKTRTKSDAYFSLSDKEIESGYDEAKDRAAYLWKGIGKQARRAAKSKFTGMKFLPKTKSAKDAGIAKAIEDMYDEHVSYECRDKDCTLCKGLQEEGTGRLATMADEYVRPEEEVSFILKAAAALSDKKRQDYAGADPDENFTRAAKFAGLICKGLPDLDRRRATAMLVGVKLARLANLGLAGSTPEHESVDDTLVDLINYTAILKRQNLRARREAEA